MLGDFYSGENNFTEAIKYVNRSLDLSKKTGEIKYREHSHAMLARIYHQQKNSDLELKHYKEYIILRDSITNLQGAEKKARSEINYEYEQKQAVEKEKQKQQAIISLAEKKRQRIILWAVISFMLLAILAAVSLYRSYLQKKRINWDLENKNQRIRHANKIIKKKIMK